jgi:hypothetical protein
MTPAQQDAAKITQRGRKLMAAVPAALDASRSAAREVAESDLHEMILAREAAAARQKERVAERRRAAAEGLNMLAVPAAKRERKGQGKLVITHGGGRRSERAAIVKRVMAEQGLKMIDASRYVKEHNLY